MFVYIRCLILPGVLPVHTEIHLGEAQIDNQLCQVNSYVGLKSLVCSDRKTVFKYSLFVDEIDTYKPLERAVKLLRTSWVETSIN